MCFYFILNLIKYVIINSWYSLIIAFYIPFRKSYNSAFYLGDNIKLFIDILFYYKKNLYLQSKVYNFNAFYL